MGIGVWAWLGTRPLKTKKTRPLDNIASQDLLGLTATNGAISNYAKLGTISINHKIGEISDKVLVFEVFSGS